VFFVGILPALFTLWIRRSVEEPAMWRHARSDPGSRSPEPAFLIAAVLWIGIPETRGRKLV